MGDSNGGSMHRQLIWCLGLLVFLPAPRAADETKPPREQVQAIQQDLQKAVQNLNSKYREAKTDEERQKIREEVDSLQTRYANELVELAAKNLRDEAAFEALRLAAGPQFSRAKTDKALELLAEEFAQHEKAGESVTGLSRDRGPAAAEILRGVAEKNGDKETKGKAIYTLATVLRNRAETSGAAPGDLTKMLEEAKQLLQDVTENYGSVKSTRGTIGDAAKNDLDLLRKIAVG